MLFDTLRPREGSDLVIKMIMTVMMKMLMIMMTIVMIEKHSGDYDDSNRTQWSQRGSEEGMVSRRSPEPGLKVIILILS